MMKNEKKETKRRCDARASGIKLNCQSFATRVPRDPKFWNLRMRPTSAIGYFVNCGSKMKNVGIAEPCTRVY